MSDHKLLEIKNLTVQYLTVDGCVHAVEGLNLSLNEGETLGLVGETGAGKTTTVKSIMRILPDPPAKIQNGEIYFEVEIYKIRFSKTRYESCKIYCYSRRCGKMR